MMSSKSAKNDGEFLLKENQITKSYQQLLSTYEAVREEISFILNHRISENSIKIHAIESRVKLLPSILQKCQRKATNNPFSDFSDIAAARIICLFRSDIDKLKNIVAENFEILEIDDKIDEGKDPLGYLSVHIVCKMKAGYTGPRYEKVMGHAFEIQIRTLCMHCWAAVSHYVDYKGEWDVPSNMKMALSALSGLFYVADSEFENFNSAIAASKRAAEEGSLLSKPQDINLDTVTALLRELFSDRLAAAPVDLSQLVQEIKLAGYASLDQLRRDLLEGANSALVYEKEYKGGRKFFTEVGVARNSLESVSVEFAKIRRLANERMLTKERTAKMVIENSQ